MKLFSKSSQRRRWRPTGTLVTDDLFYACRPQLPDRETFKGTLLHSAAWPDNGMEQLAGKRVAVIGNGASAVQLVPAIVNEVDKLDFFFRTAGWMGGKPRESHRFSRCCQTRIVILIFSPSSVAEG